jgi:hypothetical protein
VFPNFVSQGRSFSHALCLNVGFVVNLALREFGGVKCGLGSRALKPPASSRPDPNDLYDAHFDIKACSPETIIFILPNIKTSSVPTIWSKMG